MLLCCCGALTFFFVLGPDVKSNYYHLFMLSLPTHDMTLLYLVM
jgi:hypothetical protein